MPWGAQSWLRLTQENSYGVRNGSPTTGQVLWIRLYQSNAFTMRPVPQRQIIRSADSGNRRRQVVSARKVCVGNLATLLYPTQAAYLLNAATLFTGNDLASYTIDYFDSTRIQGYLGAKLQRLQITSNAQQDYVTAGIGWLASGLDPTFTVFGQPTDANFASEVPYEHIESAGQMTVGGATLTKYSSATVTIDNKLFPTWDEQPYLTNVYYCGRDLDYAFRVQYLSPTFRTEFESTPPTPLTCALEWARTSLTRSVRLDCKTTSYIATIDDEIPLDGPAYQTVGFQAFYDPANGTDFGVTVV